MPSHNQVLCNCISFLYILQAGAAPQHRTFGENLSRFLQAKCFYYHPTVSKHQTEVHPGKIAHWSHPFLIHQFLSEEIQHQKFTSFLQL